MDIDATADPTHGQQQLSFFHGYYENHIYHPLLIHDGDTGELITAVLRPGNVHASRQVVASCRRLWVHLATNYPLQTLFLTLWRRLAVT